MGVPRRDSSSEEIVDLPEGWKMAKLVDVCEILMGQSPPSSTYNDYEDGLPFYQGKADFGDVYPKPKKWCNQPQRIAKPGDVLMSVRAPVGPTNIADAECCIGRGLTAIRPGKDISLWFLFRYLKAIEEQIAALGQGSTFTSISRLDVENISIPIPPLDEQERIVTKLESILAQICTAREALGRVPGLVKAFRQSVLAAAVSDRLTDDWRNENELDSEWKTMKLSEVANSRLGKMLSAAQNTGDLHPYLRNLNVRWFGFDLSDIGMIRISTAETQSLNIQKGDVLVCEGGEPGRSAVWYGEEDFYVFQKALHRLRVSKDVLPEWICYCLKVAADSGGLENFITGTTIKHLTGVSLRRFRLKIPSVKEQKEIISRIQLFFNSIVKVDEVVQKISFRLDALEQATLAKAFRGEI